MRPEPLQSVGMMLRRPLTTGPNGSWIESPLPYVDRLPREQVCHLRPLVTNSCECTVRFLLRCVTTVLRGGGLESRCLEFGSPATIRLKAARASVDQTVGIVPPSMM
jgi:hypothetical protein